MDLTAFDPLREFGGVALALALGLLIGVQRGWASRDAAPGSRFAGLRTFGLLGLAGGLGGYLQSRAEGLALVLLAAVAALVVAGYWRTSQRSGPVSGTGSLVGLLALACGFLAATGQQVLATAATGSMVLLLAMRNQLHRWIARLDEAEMLAIARFALIALVILPLLPDRAYGPFDAWNPRHLWLVVVLVSGFSFAGYIAGKLLGPARGTIATAAAGAIVSSTAVTAALANRMREADGPVPVLSAGVAAASAVMFARVMVLTALLAPFALPTLAKVAVPALLVSLGFAAWQLWRARGAALSGAATMTVKNPFDIGPALLLMALVMVLTWAARWVLHRYGDAGLATVLALSGMVDVDSAIITMGSLPKGTLAPHLAGLVLVPPILLNTLVKAGAAISIAGWHRAKVAALSLLASTGAALVALAMVWV
jgi:uncharacterized membrane protein (DUF4010 family)